MAACDRVVTRKPPAANCCLILTEVALHRAQRRLGPRWGWTHGAKTAVQPRKRHFSSAVSGTCCRRGPSPPEAFARRGAGPAVPPAAPPAAEPQNYDGNDGSCEAVGGATGPHQRSGSGVACEAVGAAVGPQLCDGDGAAREGGSLSPSFSVACSRHHGTHLLLMVAELSAKRLRLGSPLNAAELDHPGPGTASAAALRPKPGATLAREARPRFGDGVWACI